MSRRNYASYTGLIVALSFYGDAGEAFGTNVRVQSARYVTLAPPCVAIISLVLLCQWYP